MKIKLGYASRKFKDWSLYKLANELDIPQQTIYSWAHGRTQPSYKNMDKICEILNCRIEDILEAE